MNEKEISVLLKKADELRSLFVLGQRVIPFLEEIFVFVSDIEPLLNEINSSIEENLKRMPNASKQLSKVTEATELATAEIMDIVDGINNKSDKINNFLDNIKKTNQTGFDSNIELLEIVRDGIQNNDDMSGALPELNKAIEKLKSKKEDQFGSKFDEVQEELQNISMDTSSIMMSLQVQDITSQQIAAVNNLLETVQKKLSGILKKFNENDLSEFVKEEEEEEKGINVSTMHRDIAFDPDAVESMTLKDSRQSDVDKFMEEQNQSKEDDESEASQEDIDAMFGKENLDEEAETKSPRKHEESDKNEEKEEDEPEKKEENIDNKNEQPKEAEKQENTAEKENKNEEENQEKDKDTKKEDEINDIDDGDEEFSQDDIDKLFNS